jgi:hypothetical protein
MCWNAEVSLNTFLYGLVSAIIVYVLNIVPSYIILILMSITLMQLLEYFAWTYIDNEKINEILSIIGLHIIFLQIFLVNYYGSEEKYRKYLLSTIIILYVLFVLIEFKNINFRMSKAENGHLRWHWLDLPIPWIIIGLLCYIIPSLFTKNLYGFYFIIIPLSISLYTYYRYSTWGSMWCYLSNFAWLFLLIHFFITRNYNK